MKINIINACTVLQSNPELTYIHFLHNKDQQDALFSLNLFQ